MLNSRTASDVAEDAGSSSASASRCASTNLRKSQQALALIRIELAHQSQQAIHIGETFFAAFLREDQRFVMRLVENGAHAIRERALPRVAPPDFERGEKCFEFWTRPRRQFLRLCRKIAAAWRRISASRSRTDRPAVPRESWRVHRPTSQRAASAAPPAAASPASGYRAIAAGSRGR